MDESILTYDVIFSVMSQAKQVRTNSEFDSSLKFTNDESGIKFLLEKIPQIDAVVITLQLTNL